MQTKFYKLTKPELEFLKENCNFTEDENKLLMMASKRYSDIQIADKLSISLSCVTKRKKKIRLKTIEFLENDILSVLYAQDKAIIGELKRTIHDKLT